ncbi:SERTA domain-containing protein 2b [Lampris incognitus]|uniref:SERTA domain-containing protein 2b n=1 Tax=Lampris incognitus TaxID=2546036 RepID=UPI0024B50DF1|nr:SERTA domain-containing protein 2b [Lampris incognitus]XP_056147782.1 SERTA domain-containing protein 2b [Lampris incognitus]
MYGKGAKRKLDEDEEGLEGKALAWAMMGGPGLSPEGPAPEGLSKVSYTLQRQTIFNISLMKLYSQRPPGEPSLERRVLINNMLRRIQDELKQEGTLRTLLLPPSPPPDDPMDEGFREAPPSFGMLAAAATMTPTPQVSQQSALLVPVFAPPSPHPLASSIGQAAPAEPAPLEACLTPASLLEEDNDTSFCTSPSPVPPSLPPPPAPSTHPAPAALLTSVAPQILVPASSNDGFSSALSNMELGPPTAITRTETAANATTMTTSQTPPPPQAHTPDPPLAPGSQQPRDCRTACPKPEVVAISLAEGRCGELRPMDTLPALPPGGLVDLTTSHSSSPPSSSPPSGFLSDLALDDILFADIDTSMYDFDPCTNTGVVGAAAAAAAAAAGGGLSKMSPVVTADDLLKSLVSPYSVPTPQVSANQPFKIDLTELDHIMEVLVGS